MDVAGRLLRYAKSMTRVYVANSNYDERSALILLLLDMQMDIAGESDDWLTTLAEAPLSRADMLLVDWAIIPGVSRTALEALRQACPAALVIILISQLDARQQAALSAGADAFISKDESPDRVVERLRLAAAGVPG